MLQDHQILRVSCNYQKPKNKFPSFYHTLISSILKYLSHTLLDLFQTFSHALLQARTLPVMNYTRHKPNLMLRRHRPGLVYQTLYLSIICIRNNEYFYTLHPLWFMKDLSACWGKQDLRYPLYTAFQGQILHRYVLLL